MAFKIVYIHVHIQSHQQSTLHQESRMKHHLVGQPSDTYSAVKSLKEMESIHKSIWPTDISEEFDVLPSKQSLSKLSYKLNQQFTIGLESIDLV